MIELELDQLPESYSVTTDEEYNQVLLHTQFETLIYSPEGANQLGKALIQKAEELQDANDD